ncbi:MAG: helix-turn-helix domain-containing protein [Chloroflexi bacterium]|nr:helix-turn-helix domain-containing protein [Chloroflexota bacterium]
MDTLTDNDAHQEVLTIQEAAKILRVKATTVYRLAQDNKIPAFKVGRLWRINRQALTEWQNQQQG